MPQVIDISPLLEFRDTPGETRANLLDELILAYLESSPGVLKKIAAAASSGNAESLRAAAHELKGSAANFGAHELVRHARFIEESARAGTICNQEAIRALETTAAEVDTALRENLTS